MPSVEALEDRAVPAVLTVNTAADNMPEDFLSLRQAIQVVNGTLPLGDLTAAQLAQIDFTHLLGDEDKIDFSIGNGRQDIVILGSALDSITEPVILDGAAPAALPTQRIVLNGISFNFNPLPNVNGLTIRASGATAGNRVEINNLSIVGFTGNGIEVDSPYTTIQGDYIGVAPQGTLGQGLTNVKDGVLVNNVANVIVGGTTDSLANTITDNNLAGIRIEGIGATGDQVLGNYITDNTLSGVLIVGDASQAKIGTWLNGLVVAGAGNVIVGNGADGVRIASGSNNFIGGNEIGIWADGTLDGIVDPNHDDGIRVISGQNNTIGGDLPQLGNWISGNRITGVEIIGARAIRTQILYNWIGTDMTGTAAVDFNGDLTGNGAEGVCVWQGASGTRVAYNVIAANGADGVLVINGNGTTVAQNIIGASANGMIPLVNWGPAMRVDGKAGDTARFSDNSGYYAPWTEEFVKSGGIFAPERDNSFERGPVPDGAVLAPLAPAILIVDATNANIGGTWPGAGNIIDGTIEIIDSSNVLVQGNFIGVDAEGNPLGNTGDGIFIDSASTNITIGGTAPGAGNVIASNGGAGIRVDGTGVVVQGNTIDASNGTAVVVETGADVHLSQDTLGAVLVSGGTAWFDGDTTATAVTVSGGTLNVSALSDNLLVSGNYTQTAGTTDVQGGALTVTGALDEQAGLLSLEGTTVAAAGGLSVETGASLSGWGTIAANTMLAGSLTVNNPAGSGLLTFQGNYTQAPTGSLQVKLGTGVADEIAVTGDVALAGALNLTILPGFSATPGETITLVNNEGSDPVSGTFAGLPEDADLNLAGWQFQLSYVGGTGNDVTLTLQSGIGPVGGGGSSSSS